MNVVLPADIAMTLREAVPTDKRAAFIAQAIERELRCLPVEDLGRSADLYAEIYEQDEELQELTEAALHGWPE